MKKLLMLVMLSSMLFGEWTTGLTEDKMTGEKRAYAHSKWVPSLSPMKFPYRGVKASLIIACDKKDEWANIQFSQKPNILNTETKDGYSLINTRVKVGNELKNFTFTQSWGSRTLHIDSPYLELAKHKEFLVELDWYGNGKVYFKFNVEGMRKGHSDMYGICKN